MYCYIQSEPQLWTVGFYSPDGTWHPDSDHANKEEAYFVGMYNALL